MPQYCCEKCFNNVYVKAFVSSKKRIGHCDYCGSTNVSIISVEEIGWYFRECFDKAFEPIEEGSGAIYDSDTKEYLVIPFSSLLSETTPSFTIVGGLMSI